ncbi:MAG: ATP-binding cassette domain-containing protein [Deltaproteobacteria bacterium]|nr:ATP-binding cassette domain-containing protein [Deltaproteobacteria bacterium]
MIHIEDLTKYYGQLCAVDHISLDIQKGEILGLLGPNGAGKTTTLRMLTGFLHPTLGEISVKNFTIKNDALEIKKLIGYLPESAPLYQDMLVYDYLNYVAGIRDLDDQNKTSRVRSLADQCGLKEVMHQPIGELSKGYKQRVGLAHAMMNDPEILVLDEPTSGLDPNQIVEIRQIMREIGKEKTVILSTHILSEAEATCDRIVIIDHGKIAADGDTESLRQSAGGEYRITLLIQNAPADAVKKQLSQIEGITHILPAPEPGGGDTPLLRINIMCRAGVDLRAAIYQKIKETDWVLLELHQETKSLESIFRDLTKEN